MTGILTSLCAIYKLGQRDVLLPTVETVWPCLSLADENARFVSNALIRKLLVKLAQRFGMCYLRPKVAAWRYQRGSRSLRDNLECDGSSIDPSNVRKMLRGESEDDAESEVPEQIEEIVEVLLNGLRHKVIP